jgi:hypothetical protein
VYYIQAPGVATDGTKVPIGSGIGPFSTIVPGLDPGTTYNFEAYATNTSGESLGGQLAFTTDPGLPTVATAAATGVTQTQALLGGNVSSDGGAAVSDYGVYYIQDPGVATAGTKVSMGSGTGPFSTIVPGLNPGTTYNFEAYATNTSGEGLGGQLAFTTDPGLPTVATRLPEDIKATSADLGGDVTSNGGAAVTERGIVWNEDNVWNPSNPPGSQGTPVAIGAGTGPFLGLVDSLPTDTLVYFRAYATNTAGTAYSATQSFTPTAVGGPVQASNITFPRFAGKSMRIAWTRGNGDGSTVVLRLLATGRTDPQDLIDHVANWEYGDPGSELPTGSGNFVVHKGSGNSVWVTGLTVSTTYSVAIYEYTGAGVSAVYLPLPPEEGAQATTGISAHNEDNRVN